MMSVILSITFTSTHAASLETVAFFIMYEPIKALFLLIFHVFSS
ncbi:hypothetical protein WVIC16_60086 [Weissella viridescens]|nr:hypothetical protein WVIC16_60086 [Weissella viridescens]